MTTIILKSTPRTKSECLSFIVTKKWEIEHARTLYAHALSLVGQDTRNASHGLIASGNNRLKLTRAQNRLTCKTSELQMLENILATLAK